MSASGEMCVSGTAASRVPAMFIELSVIAPPGVDPYGVEPQGVDQNGVDPNGIEPKCVSPRAPAAAMPKNVLSLPMQDAQPPEAAMTPCHVFAPVRSWSDCGTGTSLTFSWPSRIAPTGTSCHRVEAKLMSLIGSWYSRAFAVSLLKTSASDSELSGCPASGVPARTSGHVAWSAGLSSGSCDSRTWSYAVEPNGVEPNGAAPRTPVVEPNGVEPNGVEPNGVEPHGVEPNGVEP